MKKETLTIMTIGLFIMAVFLFGGSYILHCIGEHHWAFPAVFIITFFGVLLGSAFLLAPNGDH